MFDYHNSKWIKKPVTWQQALYQCVKILYENKIATMELYDAILQTTKKHGAYWVLENGIALAHAPIGSYNKKTGIAVVILENNTEFNGEKKYARILVTLSTVDANSHIDLIKKFGQTFGNDLLKSKLLAAKSLQEFLNIYQQKGGDKW